MSCLVDTNVLIDAIGPRTEWTAPSSSALIDLGASERLFVNQVIWSELAGTVVEEAELAAICEDLLIELEPIGWSAAFLAGAAHSRYRRAGGERVRTLPDFLIGAHAEVAGHKLLTRDPARYRSYFPTVEIVVPGAA